MTELVYHLAVVTGECQPHLRWGRGVDVTKVRSRREPTRSSKSLGGQG